MSDTIIEQLADFTVGASTATLSEEALLDTKLLLLDSIGCALGATEQDKGRIGTEHGIAMGGGADTATIIGSSARSNIYGAAFANGELINTLDMDSVLPPGHVSPYVIPGTLAVAEQTKASGATLVEALAVAHEMSYRLGKAMDYLRDIKDGKVNLSPVLGYSCTIFGAVAAIGKLRGDSREVIANALAIAANISPVNSKRSWLAHAPSSTIKYLLAGTLTQSAMTAAFMAALGHRGDLQVLDDREVGYPRFIGTTRWEPDRITGSLGSEWLFPAEQTYKPYPHCRILHGLLEALDEIVETNDLKPAEIDAIHAQGEASVLHPLWLSREVDHVHDAQFSIAHGLAVGAHSVVPSKAWHDPELVFGESVLGLMDRVTFEPHPDYVRAITEHPSSRPSRVEVDARGATFVAERSFPKGSPSPDPTTTMTTDELVAKFATNASGVIPEAQIVAVVEAILHLETSADVGVVIRQLAIT